MRNTRFVLASLVALLLGLPAASPAAAQVVWEPAVSGVSEPVAITHAGDGSSRLFITEQEGRIRIFDGSLRSTPFLDISSIVTSGGERGLLSVAFHPSYPSNGRFYVFYTNANGDLVVAQYTVSADPNVANPSGVPLITIPHPNAANHNGGQLQFGPDDHLYVSTGDGGGGGDQFGNAQDLGSLLGKILRLDVDGPSLIPQDNPFAGSGSGARGEIWAYGMRNPWRFSFDRQTGDMLIGDVGQGCWEEVDFEPASSSGGENYGWPIVEGFKCYDPPDCSPPPTCIDSSYTQPILAYSHSDPSDCAVTGGYVYRGAAAPQLAGTYVYGDYCSGKVWGATRSGGNWSPTLLVDTSYYISAFGEDEAGEIYLADKGSGTIYRLAAPPTDPFEDDFEDGDASDWSPVQGSWSVVAGELTNALAGNSEVIAPYAGCGACEVEATLRTPAPRAKVSLLGWRQSSRSYVELRLSWGGRHAVLRRVVNGRPVFRKSVRVDLVPGTEHQFRVARTIGEFSVFMDDNSTPLLTVRDTRAAFGTIGFRVRGREGKKVSGSFGGISVN